MKKVLAWILTLLSLAAFSVCAASAVESAYIYVSATAGSDTASGKSEADAVKTLTAAYALAEQSGADRAYIVLTDVYPVRSNLYASAHTVPIVLTANDGKTDYGARGAKLAFGSALRYYLAGDTSFSQITVTYSGTLNFVCGYHLIAFRAGTVLTRTDKSDAGVYVVGGFQTPGNGVATALDSHITIESGAFYAVIGGSRQREAGADVQTFTGTHYITVTGGSIKKVYGASVSSHYSRNAVIRVSGGEIDELYVGGDQSRRLNGNATVTLTGGRIGKLNINNIVGKADVYLEGTRIGAIARSCYNDEVTALEAAANQPKTLYYNAYTYTAEEIAAYEKAFTAAVNRTVLYAKSDGTGGGASASDAASFADAFAKAAEVGGKVLLCDSIVLQDYTEPKHTAAVTVCGADASVRLTVRGSYTLGGETLFDKLTLDGGTYRAEQGIFTAGTSLKTAAKPAIVGSAHLLSGVFGQITGAENVYVDGAAVDAVIGGTETVSVELVSGNVGSVRTSETAVQNFALTVSGGSIGTLTFKDVRGVLSVSLLGGSIGKCAVQGTNVRGTLRLGMGVSENILGDAAALFAENAENVYYLKDGGTGNGATATSAGGSLQDAYAAVGATGGTIVVCGRYTISSAFTGSTNAKPVTITSLYGGKDYAATEGAALVLGANFYCGGETVFRDLTLVSAETYISIYANLYPLTLDTGITCKTENGVTTYPSVMGGNRSAASGKTAKLTIRSGTWQRVRGGTAAGGSKNLCVELTVEGGEFMERLTLGSSASHDGDITARIQGGTFYGGIYVATLSSASDRFNGNVDLEITGGVFYQEIAVAPKNVGSYSGAYRVKILGGEFAHLTDMIGSADLRGSMLSTLESTVDLSMDEIGKMTFINPVQPAGADPWLFYYNGYYWYVSTTGSNLVVRKAANIGDLPYATAKVVYTPEEGHAWSYSLWSPEIHYYTDEEVGAGNGGWYCYIASQGGTEGNTHKMYVIKCLDGDNFFGPWGNPVTGEVNVPAKVTAPDMPDFENAWGAGMTDIRINGKLYILYVSEEDKNTPNKHQTINIAPMTNPWTILGQSSVICVPEYDWEMHGYAYDPVKGTYWPKVVEGGTAVYGDDGSVYIIYSGSGYWTIHYQLGQLKYLGGDPMDASNWEKRPTSIFSLSEEINGCGHASYCTDHEGNRWICYHAYIGKDTSSGRYAFVEPYTADANGVVIGNGTGHPAPIDTTYTVSLNPLPLEKKISAFTEIHAPSGTTLQMTLGSAAYTVNGVQKTMDVLPLVRFDRTMLPVRYVAEALGAAVAWDGATSTATITGKDTVLEITVGAATAKVNGMSVSLDSPAFIDNNRTYMPVRFVAENLGAKVAWDSATSTATITLP